MAIRSRRFCLPLVHTDRDSESKYMRAVVFVTERTPKGTPRSPQEYVNPLLVLTGEVYAKMTFETPYARICEALRGNKPKVVDTSLLPTGRARILFEDGTSKEVDA
jgi:hypothetical protein